MHFSFNLFNHVTASILSAKPKAKIVFFIFYFFYPTWKASDHIFGAKGSFDGQDGGPEPYYFEPPANVSQASAEAGVTG